MTWFQPLWRHGLQRLDFQIERGGVSQTDTWLLRSDHDPESDERIIVAGQRIVRIAMVRGLRGRAAPGSISTRVLGSSTWKEMQRETGLLSSRALEVLEAAMKSCDGVWHVWTIGDVGAGAALVAEAVGPEEANASGKPGAAGVVPPPGALVPAARFATVRGAATDIVAPHTWGKRRLEAVPQAEREACPFVSMRDIPRLPRRGSPLVWTTMKEEVMPQILILCACTHSSGHTQDHNGRSQQGDMHGSTLQSPVIQSVRGGGKGRSRNCWGGNLGPLSGTCGLRLYLK